MTRGYIRLGAAKLAPVSAVQFGRIVVAGGQVDFYYPTSDVEILYAPASGELDPGPRMTEERLSAAGAVVEVPGNSLRACCTCFALHL